MEVDIKDFLEWIENKYGYEICEHSHYEYHPVSIMEIECIVSEYKETL